jgi:hypothetical protein
MVIRGALPAHSDIDANLVNISGIIDDEEKSILAIFSLCDRIDSIDS